MKIGVTGHLSLDASARQRVSDAVMVQLPALLDACYCDHVEILSGLAPGADLVLTSAVTQVLDSRNVSWSLRAMMVGDPDEIIKHWMDRAGQLGQPPSAESASRVRAAMRDFLHKAKSLQTLSDGGQLTAFQHLAVHLATESDLLIAVLRPSHHGLPGGTAEVLLRREICESTPAQVSRDSGVACVRQTLIIDPDAVQGGIQWLRAG